MKITFLGAAKTVTGSCYYVETQNSKFLVDCGMFQGQMKEDALNEEPFPFDPSKLDFILLTHAHIDHSGRIPKIVVDGFKGPIVATKATADLCSIMLPDSGHIQEIEAEWKNRKRQRAGKPPVQPLYTFQNALDCIKQFEGVPYGEKISLKEGLKVKYNDAGHILGSAIIEVWITEEGKESKLVFSGDLGNRDVPILRDPTIIDSADYLIIESTYGNRLHKTKENKVDRFINIISETIDKGGNIVIPSFAVGRTQEVIYDLNKERDIKEPKLQKLLNVPVFVDSPLAISATEVFRRNMDCFDEEAREYIASGDNPLDFPGLQFTRTADESRALNAREGSAIIVSASGMCEAGRIRHHLKHNLWRKDCTILFVGYQAAGTLGRYLVDGGKRAKLFGEEITVNARVEMIDGFSGHADRDGLVSWIGKFKKKPDKIFIIHGEEDQMTAFAETIRKEFKIEAIIPSRGESFKLKTGNVEEHYELPGEKEKYKRLELVEQIEYLKEEFDELADRIASDLKQGRDDKEVDLLKERLVQLEKQMVEVLK